MTTSTTVKVTVDIDFSGVAASFRAAAEAIDAMQAGLTPAPAPATIDEHADLAGESASEDPQGP